MEDLENMMQPTQVDVDASYEDQENMMQPTQVDVDASYEDLENIISSQFTMTMMTKEYGIEGRCN